MLKKNIWIKENLLKEIEYYIIEKADIVYRMLGSSKTMSVCKGVIITDSVWLAYYFQFKENLGYFWNNYGNLVYYENLDKKIKSEMLLNWKKELELKNYLSYIKFKWKQKLNINDNYMRAIKAKKRMTKAALINSNKFDRYKKMIFFLSNIDVINEILHDDYINVKKK